MHVEGGKILVYDAVTDVFKAWTACVVWGRDSAGDLIYNSPSYGKQSLFYKRKNSSKMSLRFFWIIHCRWGKQ